jgi:hemerythrin
MIIPWKDAYCIDHGAIDDDHRKLLVLINDGIADLRGMAAIANIPPRLIRIRSCALAHFQREETLLSASNCALLAEHHVQHRIVLKKLDDLIGYVESGRAGRWGNRPDAQVVRALRSFLYGWLLSHLIEEDMKMRPSVAACVETPDNIIPMRAVG